jgi:hypothetical protein
LNPCLCQKDSGPEKESIEQKQPDEPSNHKEVTQPDVPERQDFPTEPNPDITKFKDLPSEKELPPLEKSKESRPEPLPEKLRESKPEFPPEKQCSYQLFGEIKMATGLQNQYVPSLAWNGNGYGLAWVDDRGSQPQIYFIQLSPDGKKVGVESLISPNITSPSELKLIWNGKEYALVVVHSNKSSNPKGTKQLYFIRISLQGKELGTAAQIIPTKMDQSVFRLVWTGAEYGIVWTENSHNLYFTTLSNIGKNQGLNKLIFSNNGNDPTTFSLNYHGNHFMLGYGISSYRPSSSAYLEVLNSKGVQISKITLSKKIVFHDLVTQWNGKNYAFLWSSSSSGSHYGHFFEAPQKLDKISTPSSLFPVDKWYFRIMMFRWTGSFYELLYNKGNRSITYYSTLSKDGKSLQQIHKLTTRRIPSKMNIVWTGKHYSIVWSDNRSGKHQVYFANYGCK